MRWYGTTLVGASVAFVGLLFMYLPGYAPPDATYGSWWGTAGMAVLVVGLVLAARGFWGRVR